MTVKTHYGQHLFGEVVDGAMKLNEFGDIVFWEWVKSEQLRNEIFLDKFVITPTYLHMIVLIFHAEGSDDSADSTAGVVRTSSRSSLRRRQNSSAAGGTGKRALSALMAGFKASATTKINQLHQTLDANVWQERYHDQIIRNEHHLNNVRQFIAFNHQNWATHSEGRCGPRQGQCSEENQP